ncbi:alpha/beta hydrolase [Pseudoduganella lutea]|uniref:alpha/beta hydrolase n=1 Tax=Pseudoduganella lutea TaxID=321985 RepID=UPI001E61944D|nr:hypothetical protein [Pseudoduganella lutea]
MLRSILAIMLSVVIAGSHSLSHAIPAYAFVEVDALPEQPLIPDPFLKPDGTRVRSRAEWPAQRAYLRAKMEHYLYGTIPPNPSAKEMRYERLSDEAFSPTGSSIKGRKQTYRITIQRVGLSYSYRFTLYRPEPLKPYPTLINNKPEYGYPNPTFSKDEGVRRGYAVVEFNRDEVAPDDPNNADRKAGVFALYPEYDFHTIGAWAWAYQPVINVLQQEGATDMAKIIGAGHSRGGATAMAAAIFDERIAFVAPSATGPFSTSVMRQRDPAGFRGRDDYAEIMVKQFPHWYHPRFRAFAGRGLRMPWDAPTLAALVAPRPLLSLSSLGDGYDNYLALESGIRADTMIYDWFGAGRWVRVHWRDFENSFGQKGHNLGPEEFLAIYDMADEYFFGKSPGKSNFNRGPGRQGWMTDPIKNPLKLNWSTPPTQ